MSYTPNIGLYLTPETTTAKFKEWRLAMNGESASNMTKIDEKFGQVDSTLSALKSFQSKIYGVSFTGSSSAGTRLEDAVDLTASVGIDDAVVTNDFDNIYPWSEMKPCNGYYNENADFVVTAYEGDPDFARNGTNGNVWIEIPIFYIKETIEGTTESKYITPYETEGFRVPEKFVKLNGTIRSKAYIAAYESGKVGGVPVSYSGVDVSTPAWSHNNFLTACKNIGKNYCAYTMEDYELISFLFQIEFATRHVQGVMQGCVSLNTTAVSVAEGASNVNYALVASSVTNFSANTPVKIHNTANSTAGAYHIISLITPYYAPAEATYDSEKSYYTRSGDAEPYTYEAYEYNEETWDVDYADLYYSTSMKKIVFEDNASVTTTTSSKIYGCPYKTGYTDNVVASSGSSVANDGKHSCKYRGIENPWGNTWTIMSGILINDHKPYILKAAANSPTNSSASSITSTMTPLSYTLATAEGYAKTMGYDKDNPTYRITTESNGSSSTYYRDYFYRASGVRALYSGGGCASGANAGLFCFSCNNAPSNSSWNISSRLSYTG